MGFGVEAELDDLLAEGGDCVVSRTPSALKRDSIWAKYPAALSAQKGGRVMLLWLLAAAIVELRKLEQRLTKNAACLQGRNQHN
jgi:hypothetical protein